MARRVTPDVLDGFFSEVRGYLPRIRRSLESFARQPSRPEELHEAYRLMHSIKGTSSMIDLGELSHTARSAEELLEGVLNGARLFDAETGESLRATIQNLESQLPPENSAFVTPRSEGSTSEFPALQNPPPQHPGIADPVSGGTTQHSKPETIADASTDSELAATVTEEFHSYLETIGAQLRALESDRARIELISEIRRPLHTMKGTAAIVGMSDVSHLAHRMEDLLTAVDRYDRAIDDLELQLLFQTTDLIVDLVDGKPKTEALATRLQVNQELFTALLESDPVPVTADDSASPSLDAGGTQSASEGKDEEQPPGLSSPSTTESPQQTESILRVRADRLDGVLNLLGDVTLQRAGFDRQVARMNELRIELQVNLRRLGRMARQVTAELDGGALAPGASTLSPVDVNPTAPEFDSLEMDRYTNLTLLARQLEEAATDSAAVGSGFEGLAREVEGFQTRLGLLTRDIQERLTQLRTVRFSTLSSRLHRTVRVTARERGKLASLVIEGGEVELDKNVLEEISEPMLHLLRNAVDHGIESSEERQVAGKPEHGTIKIQVTYQGTEAAIQVQDDGAGIDLDRLRKQATQLGALDPEEAATAAPETLYPLIFQRGFSTAKEVSEVSGRGIGLDVVNASMAQLRGMLEIESEAGVGTQFTLRLPGSQSVLRVLLFASGGESLAVPLATVDRVESIATADVDNVGGEPTLILSGESMRAFELGSTLGMPPRKQDGPQRFPAIIVRVGDQNIALLTDRILGVQEVVARPLSELLSRRLYGLGGAALTGDGRVVLVLNPNDLLREGPAETDLSTPLRQQRRPEILIVDDSLSVRQVLSRLMERNGWQPTFARDGQEALEVLEQASRVPDIAIVDLEMPRMDGYELTRALQERAIYRGIPIIILTTRSGEKHRRKAFNLGATDYLIKPFQEKTLLETLHRATSASLEKEA